MSIRPIDQVSMINKVQKVAGDRQAEKSKGEMINHNTFANIQKEVIEKRKKVNNVEKTKHNKIKKDDKKEKNHSKQEEGKDQEKDDKKGKSIDIRI